MSDFSVLLVLIAGSPVVIPIVLWAILSRYKVRYYVPLAWASGIVAPAFLGWNIYSSEGGNGDPSPLVFFVTVTVVAAAISLTTVMIAEARSVRG